MGGGSSKSKTLSPKTVPAPKPTVAPSSSPASIPTHVEQHEVIRTRKVTEVGKVFAGDALKIHNEYRVLHGAPPLVLCPELSAHAQDWAEEIAEKDMLIRSKCRLADGRIIGENIYRGNSVDGTAKIKAKEPIDTWYNEMKFYDFNNKSSSSKSSQFTQLVWKATTHFGIAQATSSEGGVYVVANYSPAGNTSEKFDENVKPPPGFEREKKKEEMKKETKKEKHEIRQNSDSNEIKKNLDNNEINNYNDYECLDDIEEENEFDYEFDTVYAREVTNIII